MYREFYGLKEKPFNILPDPDFFYLSPWHQQAITHIEYGLMNGDSLILLTGMPVPVKPLSFTSLFLI